MASEHPTDQRPLAVITGGNSGIGLETARGLLIRGFRVIITVRSHAKGERAIGWLRKEFTRNRGSVSGESAAPAIDYLIMDLGSLESVRSAAESLLQSGDRIDVLVLNAGVLAPPYQITRDGYELQFQVNYLSHFLFTRLLEPAMGCPGSSRDPRVISISSLSGENAKATDLDGLIAPSACKTDEYHPVESYRNSKLAQVVFTRGMRETGPNGSQYFAVHPGIIPTHLLYRTGSRIGHLLVQPVFWLGYAVGVFRTPRWGARTGIYLATSEDPGDALYWCRCRPRKSHPLAQDADTAARFCRWSEETLGR